MKTKICLKVLILFLLSCILIPADCISTAAYYELTYNSKNDENVKIDDIYYDFYIMGNKEDDCYTEAFYPVVSGDVLKFPDKVTYKGKEHKVDSVVFDAEYMYYKNNPLTKLVLPYEKIYLPKYAISFWLSDNVSLPNLEEIYIPKRLDKFDLSCLNDMPNLKIIIDEDNPYVKMKNGALYSKDGKKLHALVNSTKTYKIAKGTKQIFFGKNKTVEKVVLPSSIKKLSPCAFQRCFKLKSVKLNKQLKVIKWDAFYKCKSLKKITIPENVNKIQRRAFSKCGNLSKVIIKSSKQAPDIENKAFNNTKYSIKFIVKNQTVADQLKNRLKGSGVKNAEILVGSKMVYKNVN